MKKGLISIVIPVVRNDPHVAEAVDHIARSTYKDYEILIVDEGLERSAQRNIGIKRAQGEFLFILDSDMMLSPHLLEECVHTMARHESLVGLYIPERIVTKGWFGKMRDWERQFYTGTLIDVVRFVRAEGCPLFDEEMHGVEDSDWERRLVGDKRITFNHFDHHDKCGLVKFLKKKFYYARCISYYQKKNPNDKLLTMKYRCFDVFVEDSKWKKFIAKPHFAIGVILLIFARGIIFYIQKRRFNDYKK